MANPVLEVTRPKLLDPPPHVQVLRARLVLRLRRYHGYRALRVWYRERGTRRQVVFLVPGGLTVGTARKSCGRDP